MSEEDKITSYKEYEECLKKGELKIIKGMGRSFAYNSIGLLKTLLERDYSVALEDSIVHITSYINDIEKENKQLKERITYLENSNNRREETIINLRHEQQLDKYKEVIEEVREYINNLGTQDGMLKDYKIDRFIKEDLLQILDKAKENK